MEGTVRERPWVGVCWVHYGEEQGGRVATVESTREEWKGRGHVMQATRRTLNWQGLEQSMTYSDLEFYKTTTCAVPRTDPQGQGEK